RLQGAELLLVLEVHQLTARLRMVEPDSMADLMGGGVPAVIDIQVAIEADLPPLLGIEADDRAFDRAPVPFPGLIGNVRECAAERFELGANEDASAARVIDLGEPNVGNGLPHIEGGTYFVAEIVPIEVRFLEDGIDRPD